MDIIFYNNNSASDYFKKLESLKNVNKWELVYYGYSRQFLNDSFIFQYSDYILETRPYSDQIAPLISGLLENEKKDFKKIFPILLKIDTDTFYKKDYLYNKIWLYIEMSVEMAKENIIN